jgi:hypothetical protein
MPGAPEKPNNQPEEGQPRGVNLAAAQPGQNPKPADEPPAQPQPGPAKPDRFID